MKNLVYLVLMIIVLSCQQEQQEPVAISKTTLDKSALKSALDANADFNSLPDAWDSYVSSIRNNSQRISSSQKTELDVVFVKVNSNIHSLTLSDKEVINNLVLKNTDNHYFDLKNSIYSQLTNKYQFSITDFNELVINKTKRASANAKEAPGGDEDCIKVMNAMWAVSYTACINAAPTPHTPVEQMAFIFYIDRCSSDATDDSKIAYIGCTWGQIGIRN